MGATQLGEAQVPIRATLDKLDADLAAARSRISSAVEGISAGLKSTGTLALSGFGAAVAGVGALGAAVASITIDAAPVEGLSKAFAGLAESAGYGADEMLDALKRGSAGMISQRDLMMSFNKAASLVGTDFATQLPDAMQYLGKVSASTGQDMGFLMDSLVVGVGRLSPMILDNLGIQVSLASATERASEMYGVEASALTKAQQQAGMMAVALEKLEANTASMPDVTETAAAKMARLKAEFQDTKDRIGMAFMPVLTTVLETFGTLAERFTPMLIAALEKIAPVVEQIVLSFSDFIAYVSDGLDPIHAFNEVLAQLLPAKLASDIGQTINQIVAFAATVGEALAPVMAWVSENVELQDVLMALGIAIASVVLPALWSAVVAVAPVIGAFALVVAAVAGLRMAWENDFLGIRSFVETTLAQITAWWTLHGEEVIAKAVAIYETVRGWIETGMAAIGAIISTVLGAIQAWWSEHGESVMVIVGAYVGAIINNIRMFTTTISTIISTVLKAIGAFWEEHGDAIMEVATITWDTIKTIVETVLENISLYIDAVALAIQGDWEGFGQKLREIWDNTWKMIGTILENAWENMMAVLGEAIENIKNLFKNTDWKALGKAIIEGIVKGIRDNISMIVDVIKRAIQAAWDAVVGFFGGGGSSALEVAAVLDVEMPRVEEIAGQMAQAVAVAPRLAAAGSETVGKQIVIYGLTLNGVQDAGGLLAELERIGN
jgi:phage-related protein